MFQLFVGQTEVHHLMPDNKRDSKGLTISRPLENIDGAWWCVGNVRRVDTVRNKSSRGVAKDLNVRTITESLLKAKNKIVIHWS